MDVVNVALENSPLANLINSSEPVDVFSYGSENINSHSRQTATVTFTGASLAQEASVDIPKYGILTDIIVKADVTFTPDAGDTSREMRDGPQWLSLLDYVEMASSNRVISRMTQKSLAGELSFMDSDKRTAVEAGLGAKVTGADTTQTNQLIYLPFLYSLSSKRADYNEKNYRGCLDTRFVENLTLRVKTQSAANVKGHANNALTLNSLVAQFFYVVPSEEVYRSIEESNYSSGPLNILHTNTFSETKKAVADTAATVTIPLNSNGLVKKMYIQIEKDSEIADAATVTRQKSHEITSIKINGSGREIFSIDGKVNQFLDDFNKSGTASEAYVLDFSAMPNKSGFTGGISLREIANAEVELSFSAVSGAHTATVEHSQYELLGINPANGRISVSLSS
jgi:hypothetical protein